MFKRYSIVFVVISIFVFSIYVIYSYFIDVTVRNIFLIAEKNIKNEINNKLKDTLAISITLSKNPNIKSILLGNEKYLKNISDLPKIYKNYTNYKNIWIALIDKNEKILFRSWSEQKGDSVKNYFQNVEKIFKNPKFFSIIFTNRYTLAFHSLSPVFDEDRFLGYVAIISHFNSIIKNLEKLNLKALVVADKKYKNMIIKPYTNTFLNDYYVANFNIDKNFINIVKEIGIEKIIKNHEYIRYKDYFFNKYRIKDAGWIVVAISLEDIYKSFYKNRIFLYLVFLFLLITALITVLIYIYTKDKQKALENQMKYYYNTLNSLQDIVIVTDGEKIKFANKRFFEYFNKYKNLDEFLKEHGCICDFFMNEKGFLAPIIDGKRWTKYIIEKNNQTSKAKITYNDRIYIFLVKATKLSKNEYSIIFSDITEDYKKHIRLKEIAQKDELTNLYNRRTFNIFFKNSFKKAKEKNLNLWLAILDIDHFKHINDVYGHLSGDKVLKEIANIIKNSIRDEDEVFRIGGEEFAIILKNISYGGVKRVLERVRKRVKSQKFSFMDEHITISIGATKLKQKDREEKLFKRADMLLYEAKSSGRDRVVID